MEKLRELVNELREVEDSLGMAGMTDCCPKSAGQVIFTNIITIDHFRPKSTVVLHLSPVRFKGSFQGKQ